MLRVVGEARSLVAMLIAAGIGGHADCTRIPWQPDNLFLALTAVRNPRVFHVLTYGYATPWFSALFFAASVLLSVLGTVVYRHAPSVRTRPLPTYPLQKVGSRLRSCWARRICTPHQAERRRRHG